MFCMCVFVNDPWNRSKLARITGSDSGASYSDLHWVYLQIYDINKNGAESHIWTYR